MQKITTTAGLKIAIQLLKVEKANKEELLKEQFNLTLERLKPINILKRAAKNIESSPSLISDVINASAGLAVGYLSKKIIIGTSGNIFQKLFGSALQYGVTSIIVKHPEYIKAFGNYIINKMFHKKE